jgi:biotin carboxyl carrier protein
MASNWTRRRRRPVARVSIRASIRGVHAGLLEPLVVGAGDEADVTLATLDARDGRATLAEVGKAADGERHQVLLATANGAPNAAPIGGPRVLEVVVDGWRFEVEVEPESRAALRERARRDRGDAGHSGPAEVHAIIPGVVVSIAVAAGDQIEAGQQLLVVEAMKMQNELRAPRAGRIERVTVGERSTIEVGDLLVVIE